MSNGIGVDNGGNGDQTGDSEEAPLVPWSANDLLCQESDRWLVDNGDEYELDATTEASDNGTTDNGLGCSGGGGGNGGGGIGSGSTTGGKGGNGGKGGKDVLMCGRCGNQIRYARGWCRSCNPRAYRKWVEAFRRNVGGGPERGGWLSSNELCVRGWRGKMNNAEVTDWVRRCGVVPVHIRIGGKDVSGAGFDLYIITLRSLAEVNHMMEYLNGQFTSLCLNDGTPADSPRRTDNGGRMGTPPGQPPPPPPRPTTAPPRPTAAPPLTPAPPLTEAPPPPPPKAPPKARPPTLMFQHAPAPKAAPPVTVAAPPALTAVPKAAPTVTVTVAAPPALTVVPYKAAPTVTVAAPPALTFVAAINAGGVVLPVGWEAFYEPNVGAVYYWYHPTGVSTWDAPIQR